jgi:hypothetical protein
MNRFRSGDRVSLEGVVLEHQAAPDKAIRVKFVDSEATFSISPKGVKLIRSHFIVGDRVTWNRDAENIGIIRATAGAGLDQMLWVEKPNGKMETLDAIVCERAEDVDPEEIAAPPPMPAGGIGSDGWIKWHGGQLPVGAVDFVEVRQRSGKQLPSAVAQSYRWSHAGDAFDIVAYRVDEMPF